MRDKESVTQIFILYGYEKSPRCHTHRELFYAPGSKGAVWWGVR